MSPFLILIISAVAILLIVILVSIFKRARRIELSDNDAVLISGCDSGIGLSLAKHFHKTLNCKIICGFLNISPNSQGHKEMMELKQSEDGQESRILLYKLDLTSAEDIANLKAEISKLKIEKGISLFALINNAAVLNYGEFDWFTWGQIQSQIDVNLTGTIRLTHAMLEFILERKGRIINVSSVSDSIASPGISVYSATKCAISTFAQAIGFELRKFGVSVVTIRLGHFTGTNIMAKHESNVETMWSHMSPVKKDMYKDYFHEFNRFPETGFKMSFKNLSKAFNIALLSREPSSTIYGNTDFGSKIFYFILELLPKQFQYHITSYLIRLVARWYS